MSVDLEAIEKLCGKQTFTAYGSEVLLGSLADEVPGFIAEVRTLRARVAELERLECLNPRYCYDDEGQEIEAPCECCERKARTL